MRFIHFSILAFLLLGVAVLVNCAGNCMSVPKDMVYCGHTEKACLEGVGAGPVCGKGKGKVVCNKPPNPTKEMDDLYCFCPKDLADMMNQIVPNGLC